MSRQFRTKLKSSISSSTRTPSRRLPPVRRLPSSAISSKSSLERRGQGAGGTRIPRSSDELPHFEVSISPAAVHTAVVSRVAAAASRGGTAERCLTALRPEAAATTSALSLLSALFPHPLQLRSSVYGSEVTAAAGEL